MAPTSLRDKHLEGKNTFLTSNDFNNTFIDYRNGEYAPIVAVLGTNPS